MPSEAFGVCLAKQEDIPVPGAAVRWLAVRCFGYDPALGAVLVMGRKA